MGVQLYYLNYLKINAIIYKNNLIKILSFNLYFSEISPIYFSMNNGQIQ